MFLKLFHCQGTTNTLLWETLVLYILSEKQVFVI